MSPATHFFGSWLIASFTTANPRDRKLVTWAGVLPDADGLGLVVDVVGALLTGSPIRFHYYQRFHHHLAHGWPAAIVIIALLTCFARDRWRVALLCLVTFHVHLLCDLVGSRGPGPADLWPIAYGEPLFLRPVWWWRGQWRLDGWQKQTLSGIVFALNLWRATTLGASCLEVFSARLDAALVGILRKWRQATVPARPHRISANTSGRRLPRGFSRATPRTSGALSSAS